MSKVWSVLEEGYALVEYVNAAKEPMVKLASRGLHVNVTTHAVRAVMESVLDPLRGSVCATSVVVSTSPPQAYCTMGHSVTAVLIHRPAETQPILQSYVMVEDGATVVTVLVPCLTLAPIVNSVPVVRSVYRERAISLGPTECVLSVRWNF